MSLPSDKKWRSRDSPTGGSITPSQDFQLADEHLRDHFSLFLYVPTEQVGIIIGKKGAKIQYIQGATNTRVIMAANASKDWDSAWFQVMVKGSPSGCYMAYKIISSLVEELDDSVAQFPIPRARHSLIIGRSGLTIRRISADSNVRIYVPGKKDENGGTDIQLEGETGNVMRALSMIMEVVYASGAEQTHATAAEEQNLKGPRTGADSRKRDGDSGSRHIEHKGREKESVAMTIFPDKETAVNASMDDVVVDGIDSQAQLKTSHKSTESNSLNNRPRKKPFSVRVRRGGARIGGSKNERHS